eukprot:scaffold241_cov242-Pinguiococcus_pyrenoidosus.AAC.30
MAKKAEMHVCYGMGCARGCAEGSIRGTRRRWKGGRISHDYIQIGWGFSSHTVTILSEWPSLSLHNLRRSWARVGAASSFCQVAPLLRPDTSASPTFISPIQEALDHELAFLGVLVMKPMPSPFDGRQLEIRKERRNLRQMRGSNELTPAARHEESGAGDAEGAPDRIYSNLPSQAAFPRGGISIHDHVRERKSAERVIFDARSASEPLVGVLPEGEGAGRKERKGKERKRKRKKRSFTTSVAHLLARESSGPLFAIQDAAAGAGRPQDWHLMQSRHERVHFRPHARGPSGLLIAHWSYIQNSKRVHLVVDRGMTPPLLQGSFKRPQAAVPSRERGRPSLRPPCPPCCGR